MLNNVFNVHTFHIIPFLDYLYIRFFTDLGRHNYVTPTSYLELISAFKTLLGKKRDETFKAKRRYMVGLEKLRFAEAQVGEMQVELVELQPKLVVAAEENEKMMKVGSNYHQ